jgi:hypothetical protein
MHSTCWLPEFWVTRRFRRYSGFCPKRRSRWGSEIHRCHTHLLPGSNPVWHQSRPSQTQESHLQDLPTNDADVQTFRSQILHSMCVCVYTYTYCILNIGYIGCVCMLYSNVYVYLSESVTIGIHRCMSLDACG